MISLNSKVKVSAVSVILLALLIVPAPLLPPHRLAETVQSMAKLGWATAYLVAAIGLQMGFYASLGMLAALVVNRASTLRGRLLQILILVSIPLGVSFFTKAV